MRYFVFFLLFIGCSTMILADELTTEQCKAIGGTYTKAGCLMLEDSEKAKYGTDKTYMPGKDECGRRGGTWSDVNGCLAKISEDECKAIGGKMQNESGCTKKPTQEQCDAIGGNFDKNKDCMPLAHSNK